MLITQYFKNQLCLGKMKMEYVIIYLRNWVKNNTAKKCSVMGIIRMII